MFTEAFSIYLRGERVATIYHSSCKCGVYKKRECVGYTTDPAECGARPLAEFLTDWLRQYRFATLRGAVLIRHCMNEGDWKEVRDAVQRV